MVVSYTYFSPLVIQGLSLSLLRDICINGKLDSYFCLIFATKIEYQSLSVVNTESQFSFPIASINLVQFLSPKIRVNGLFRLLLKFDFNGEKTRQMVSNVTIKDVRHNLIKLWFVIFGESNKNMINTRCREVRYSCWQSDIGQALIWEKSCEVVDCIIIFEFD